MSTISLKERLIHVSRKKKIFFVHITQPKHVFLSDKHNCIDSVFSAKHRILDINFALSPIFHHPKELHKICCTKRNQKEAWACNVNNTVNYVSKLNIWLHKYIFQIIMIIEWKAHMQNYPVNVVFPPLNPFLFCWFGSWFIDICRESSGLGPLASFTLPRLFLIEVILTSELFNS